MMVMEAHLDLRLVLTMELSTHVGTSGLILEHVIGSVSLSKSGIMMVSLLAVMTHFQEK